MHCGHVREDRGGGVESNEVGVDVAQIIQKRMPCKREAQEEEAGAKDQLPLAHPQGFEAGPRREGEKPKKKRPEPKTNCRWHWHIHKVLEQVSGEKARSARRRGRSPRRKTNYRWHIHKV